jgi:hypothetical protein
MNAQPQPGFQKADDMPPPFNPMRTNVNVNLQKAL